MNKNTELWGLRKSHKELSQELYGIYENPEAMRALYLIVL